MSNKFIIGKFRKYPMKKFIRFLKEENGATAIEYALIASLIAMAIIVTATALGAKLGSTFGFILSQFKDL
jgi:pilus assembly protein Flp/PilA